MIYFDNSATTLMKPPEVAEAVAFAINNFANSGRSYNDAALTASREIYSTRMEIAKLIGHDEPLNIAFTSSATESLNLVIGGLVNKDDSVITTVVEHNSMLRPLYNAGCDLSFISCDDNGNLLVDSLGKLIKPSTKYLFCSHGSNVTGNITDVYKLKEICAAHGIIMVLDISQTFGTIPVKIDMADVFCFTGHKSLFGPQGTGGVIVNGSYEFRPSKTGGAGVNSFQRFQSKDMPDVFEAGTLNSHGIYGLQKGLQFINRVGVRAIHERESHMAKLFYNGVRDIDRLVVYGDFSKISKLPIVSFNIGGLTSAEAAEKLWACYGIACRPGSHCAPLLHKHFDTEDRGMVRFSFSYYNTEDEIKKGVSAVKEIASGV